MKMSSVLGVISYKALVAGHGCIVLRTMCLVCWSELGEGTWWWYTFMFCLQSTCSHQVNAIGRDPVVCNINSNHIHTQQLIVRNFCILI